MGIIQAVPPTIPAAGLAMSPNQGTVVLQAAGVAGVVPGVAINSAAAGVLFGMLMTQLAAGMSQPALGKETDAKAPKDSEAPQGSESQTQTSPDATSVLASLVPLLVSLQIAPQPVNPVATESPKAVSTGPVSAVDPTLTPLALAALAATAIGPSEHPALSMETGKQFEAVLLQNPLPVTVAATAVQEATTQLPGMPVIPTPEQGSGIHTILATIPTAGEGQKPSEAATTGDAGPVLGQVLSPPLSSDKKLDQLQALVPSSVLIDATLTTKKDEGRDNLLNLLSERNTRVTDSMPLGTEKIPAEFLAAPAASPIASADSAVPVPKATMVGDALPTAMTSPRETIHLQFGPSELGRLTLQVSLQSQQVQATVSVEHRGLGELLAASQGALDGALRQHGLRLEELHIGTMGNADVLGAGAGRTGLLDHGQPRQDSPRFDREPLTSPATEREVSITRADVLEPLGSRHRINLFA